MHKVHVRRVSAPKSTLTVPVKRMQQRIDQRANPTPVTRDALLAQVAIAPSAEGWTAWRERCPDVDGLSPTEFRLLPFVWQQIRAQGVIDSVYDGKLRGIHRKIWYQNRLRLNWAGRLVEQLHAAGFQVLFLKGLRLIQQFDWDPGTRPCADVDLWVRPSQYAAAKDFLLKQPGMQATGEVRAHACDLVFNSVHALDLHRLPHLLADPANHARGSTVGLAPGQGPESLFDAAWAQQDDLASGLTLSLLNAFIHDGPDRRTAISALVDWHRTGIAWASIAPTVEATSLRPAFLAQLDAHPEIVAQSPVLRAARAALADRSMWSRAEQALAANIKTFDAIRAQGYPWSYHHWLWTLAGYTPWQRDLKSIRYGVGFTRKDPNIPLHSRAISIVRGTAYYTLHRRASEIARATINRRSADAARTK